MPKYMINARFTPQAIKGILAEGGTARRVLVEKSLANLGGRVESFYYSFGAEDALVIAELPDNATAAAVSMAVGASGAAAVSTTPLLTCEDMDAASRLTVDYTPPGG